MDLAAYFRSPAHVRVLDALITVERALCFRDVVEISGISISSAQNALKYFGELKLIKRKKVGQEFRYFLNEEVEEVKTLREIFKTVGSAGKKETRVLQGGLKIIRAIESANRLVATVRKNA